MVPIISIVGASNSGKTTLLEKIITALTVRGYRVAAVKHDIHGFDVDHEGKDSWRLKRAGADAVIISSPKKVAIIQDVIRDQTLEELSNRFKLEVDIILSEGYKKGPYPKIEVFREGYCAEHLCKPEDNLIAIVSDIPLKVGVPCINIDDPDTLVDFIEKRFLCKNKPVGMKKHDTLPT